MKKPVELTAAQKRDRIEKEFLQIVKRPSFRGRYDAVYLRLCKKYGVAPMEAGATRLKPARKKPPRAISKERREQIKKDILTIARDQEINPRTFEEFDPLYKKYGKENVMKIFAELDQEPGWLGKTFGGYRTLSYKGKDFLEESQKKPKKKAKKESLSRLQKTPEYQSGYDKGLQEAALGKYSAHNSKSDNWKKGYDAGWRKAFKDPKYDEIVLINTEEDITAWEKRRAVLESERFQIWLNERINTPPMPSDPFQAYMIDLSLEATLKEKPEWAKRTNRADWLPVDYPPITKKPAPDITEPSPKTLEAEKTKDLLRARSKYLAEEMGISEPNLRFTVAQRGRARSFYRSGFAMNRITGQIVKVGEPEIVIGIPRSGKIYPENYATLSHEMGHHKSVVNLERRGGRDAVRHHYSLLRRSKAARIESEREAWKEADPFLKDHRPAQKWLKKYAFGTYLGTTPKHGKHD